MNPPNVRLRPWHTDDLPELVRLADSYDIFRNLRDAFPHPYTESAGRAWLERIALHNPPQVFAVTADGQVAGSIGYVPGQDIERCAAEIGYWIGGPFQGRGLATAAVRQLVDLAFATGRFTRLFATPFAENSASCRVLEKAGFTRDAILKRAAIKEDRVRDFCLYSRLAPDAAAAPRALKASFQYK